MAETPLDAPQRRALSLFATAFYKAHLGYVPVNEEWVGVCEVCWGDGCQQCQHTGVKE